MPSDITERWEAIAVGIDQSLPPYVYREPKVFESILHRLMLDDMQCWALTKDSESDIQAIATTLVTSDGIADIKTLLIYSLYAYLPTSGELWKEGIESLKKYAKHRGCSALSAYSINTRVEQIAKLTGGESNNYLMWRTLDENI
jgi:hypothetical protein